MADCVTCSDTLSEERAALGFQYCMRAECQRANFQGVTVTAVGVNKAADAFFIGDVTDRAARGELGKKNTTLGSDSLPSLPTNPRRGTIESTRRRTSGTQTRTQRPWTDSQEQYVRARVAAGATPRQIVISSGRMGLTVRMIGDIMATRPRRR